MGIIGKTQGVKIEARPRPKAVRRNGSNPEGGSAAVDEVVEEVAGAEEDAADLMSL
jgi:hypothetical protein